MDYLVEGFISNTVSFLWKGHDNNLLNENVSANYIWAPLMSWSLRHFANCRRRLRAMSRRRCGTFSINKPGNAKSSFLAEKFTTETTSSPRRLVIANVWHRLTWCQSPWRSTEWPFPWRESPPSSVTLLRSPRYLLVRFRRCHLNQKLDGWLTEMETWNKNLPNQKKHSRTFDYAYMHVDWSATVKRPNSSSDANYVQIAWNMLLWKETWWPFLILGGRLFGKRMLTPLVEGGWERVPITGNVNPDGQLFPKQKHTYSCRGLSPEQQLKQMGPFWDHWLQIDTFLGV